MPSHKTACSGARHSATVDLAGYFVTRGVRKDLGQILGTEQWKYASLAADGYFYGATDDALVKVKSDGSDITVLHAFTGKDDHPLGAPILIGNMLYGYAHDEPKESGVKPSAGYIYKLNSDGTGYSTLLKLEYDPKGPLLSQGNFLYGMAEPVTRDRIASEGGQNFRRDRSVIPGGFFRMAVDSATSTLVAPTKETIVPDAMIIYNGAAYVSTHSSQVDNSIFRIPIGDGVSAMVQSGTGQTTGSSAAASAVASTGAAPSNPAPASSAAPAPGGKSVFHKRDNAVSTGAPPSQQGNAEQQPSSVSGFSSDNAPQTAGARPAGGGTPATTKKTKFPSNQTNDSGPLSGDTVDDASQTDAGAYQAAPGGSASSFGGLGSNRTNSYAGTSAGGGSDTSAIAGMVVEAYSNGDLATFASLYADTVDYMGHRRTSNADVQRQLSQYFAKWPVRQWQLVGTVSVRPVGPSAQRVAFSAQYDLSNPNNNSHAAGIANETLIVKDDGTGAMKITSHQEEVNSNSDSDTAGEKKRRRPNRERVYDGRPILPPNLPLPFPIPRP